MRVPEHGTMLRAFGAEPTLHGTTRQGFLTPFGRAWPVAAFPMHGFDLLVKSGPMAAKSGRPFDEIS